MEKQTVKLDAEQVGVLRARLAQSEVVDLAKYAMDRAERAETVCLQTRKLLEVALRCRAAGQEDTRYLESAMRLLAMVRP